MQHATNRITISFVLIYPALFRLIPWFPTFCVLRGRQQQMSKSDMVYRYTASKIEYLHSIADTGRGKGYLAELRHGIGKKPGELPSLWWLIFDRIDEELKGSKCASNAEWAVYTALTLYSLHQQGNDRFMYEKGYTLGRAAYHIANSSDDEERVVNRLNLVVTSTTKEELAYQLKSICRQGI